ncbi:hypothetical protein FRX31_032324, partial [Thalictrum thalictroides]
MLRGVFWRTISANCIAFKFKPEKRFVEITVAGHQLARVVIHEATYARQAISDVREPLESLISAFRSLLRCLSGCVPYPVVNSWTVFSKLV